MCCDSWGRKESDTTERLNGTELNNHLSCSGATSNIYSDSLIQSSLKKIFFLMWPIF